MIHTSTLSSRNQLGGLLNDRGLVGRAAEVGTHRGDFASILLGKWRGKALYCVDHWDVPAGYETQAGLLPEKGRTRGDDFEAAKRVLGKSRRVRFLRMTSREASCCFHRGELDFVYVDADHSEQAVAEDMNLWWPKIKPGGILAGHDFVCPGDIDSPHNWGRGIQRAVMSFADRNGLDVYVIPEEKTQPWSWMLFKG